MRVRTKRSGFAGSKAWAGLGLGLALLCAACDGAGQPVQGVQHLDPRLADGRSAAAVLATRRNVARSWMRGTEEPTEADFAPWELVNGEFAAVEGWEGSVVRAREWRPDEGLVQAGIGYRADLDAADVDVIEVDAVVQVAGSATLLWRSAPKPDLPPRKRRMDIHVESSREVQTLRFPLSAREGWTGAIRDLRILPVERGGGQVFGLVAIRFVSEAFSYGAEPLAGAREGESGDGGLFGFEGDLRRTWPTDLGVPLVARALVPRSGRMVVASALSGDLHSSTEEVHFALDVALSTESGEPAWKTGARRSVLPASRPKEARWRSLVLDLSGYEGREVALRMRAWKGARTADGTGGELERARVFWGAPMVIGQLSRDRRPDVLLVTLDTTRVDAIGAYGGSAETPNIDRLASQGLLFEDAWTGCNSTLPAHVSMLTGLPVPAHGVPDNRSTLAPEVRSLAQVFRSQGYHTAAAVSVHHLKAEFSGLGRGFDRYLDVTPGAPRDGTHTLAGVEAWLAEWRDEGERPFFLWVHLFDPHTPYGPPPEFLARYAEGREVPPRTTPDASVGRTRYTEEDGFLAGVTNADYARYLYEAGVAYTDHLVGRLFAELADHGLYERTLLVLTADHGESLGDNDVWYGHQMLYPPVMHVPLVVRHPQGESAGERVSSRVSTVDIARTLVETLALPGLEAASGSNLFDVARAPERHADRRVWFLHSHLDQVGFRDNELHFAENLHEYLQLGRERALPAGERYLYRPAGDPACGANRAPDEAGLADRCAEEAQAWLSATSSGRTIPRELSDAERRQLEGLGYGGHEPDGGHDRDGD